MPNSTLTEAIKEAYASAPTDVVLLNTIEIRHPSFTVPIRAVSDHRDWTAKLEASAPLDAGTFVDFIGFEFEIEQPKIEEGATAEFVFAISNVDRQIIDNLELAVQTSDKIEVSYRPYLSNDIDGSGRLNGPQMDPPIHMVMSNVNADMMRVTARARFDDYANLSFPGELYTFNRFPGLLR